MMLQSSDQYKITYQGSVWETNLRHKSPFMMTQELADFLAGEMLVFGVLGKMLYKPPQAEWLKSLVYEEIFSEIPFGSDIPETIDGLKLLRNWASNFTEDTVSSLDGEYNRLFVGPGTLLAAPWESVYATKDRLIFQEQTLQVRNFYRKFGLEIERIYHEPDDHIGLELIFVAHLASLALSAMENQDQKEFDRLILAQWEFLSDHLLKWAFEWTRDVREFSKQDFFRGAALVVEGGLKSVRTTFENQYGMTVD